MRIDPKNGSRWCLNTDCLFSTVEGYARFGFIYETATSLRPIGTSIREEPIPLLGLNCASCHQVW